MAEFENGGTTPPVTGATYYGQDPTTGEVIWRYPDGSIRTASGALSSQSYSAANLKTPGGGLAYPMDTSTAVDDTAPGDTTYVPPDTTTTVTSGGDTGSGGGGGGTGGDGGGDVGVDPRGTPIGGTTGIVGGGQTSGDTTAGYTSTTGYSITAGEGDDYYAAAKSVLERLGVVSRTPTDDEVIQFASGKMAVEGISDYYSFLPELVAKNPGLPYGVSNETYNQTKNEYSSAYTSVFGGRDTLPDSAAPRSKSDRESSLLGYGLTRGISSQQFARTAEQFRQERGRAPTTSEFDERFNRVTQPSSGGGVPSSPETGPRPRMKQPGIARPAVGI